MVRVLFSLEVSNFYWKLQVYIPRFYPHSDVLSKGSGCARLGRYPKGVFFVDIHV